MSAELDKTIARTANEAIAGHVFPGAVIGYIEDGVTTVATFGAETYEPDAPVVTADLMYDAASITKVLPTNTLILMLIDQGKLSLDDRAITYLPEIANEYRAAITIRHLLCYMVAPHLTDNLVKIALAEPSKLLERLYSAPLVAAPGEVYKYNDTAIIWLGLIAERVSGRKLDDLARDLLFEPLGLSSATLHPTPQMMIAPSEINDRGLVQHEVHDETAWVLGRQGIVSGNAGLVITTGDLLTFAQMFFNGGELNGRRYLSEALVEQVSINQYPAVTPYAGLGWFTQQDEYFGTAIGSRTFGMTGFTGSMILIDPVAGRALAMGSNRVYPKRTYDRDAINAVRRALAAAVLPA